LLVDDEPDILFVFKRTLEGAGYSISGYRNPIAALEHYKTSYSRYALVICDLRMPTLSGIQFLIEARRMNPDIRVMLMSAFPLKDIGLPPDFQLTCYLEKPITSSQLVQIVSSCLETIA
jgi:DNA-binding NtrC family response regulator